ncbi:DEAD/DEAH box helicase [Zavarzinia compransoris]|uniref:DEAD-box ATP-dependent RNA helicase RhpA n=1 Tax=Zavarzinia compransoris TaxID=1264899 RepID=A0A317EET1_9PROT|nr:DEAD/DEAH box helicase [Zavarzinia compransoris]PWR23883.1 DNA helicase [Zavarzinia compransoris]TDP48125.1 superfamily II DNA/RNA helicase [Zavarzinia compransoris]
MSFEELGLSAEVLRAVAEAGYAEPTPIQAQAIPQVLQGRDVMGIAQTGTGKTASFTLPMIDVLAAGRPKARMPRSLILEPTRELAAQVAENFEKYGKYHKLSMALLIGGTSMDEQVKKLDRGVDVLIATPGRLLDHFERGRIMMSGIKVLVVDEADRMLDMGFIPDLERICSLLPGSRQTLFFSATMLPEVKRLADKFLTLPVEISVARASSTATTITQRLAVVDEADKRPALRHLLRTEEIRNAIIFCNRKVDVDIVGKSLQKHGFNAAALHGDMVQSERNVVLERFRAGEVPILVASDVAARGLDVAEISHVFNFDVPIHAEDYVHRIGRTGRAGREGKAFTLASPYDTKFVKAIEDLIKQSIERLSVDGIEPCELLSDAEAKARKRSRGRATATVKGVRGPKARKPEAETVEAAAPAAAEDSRPPRGRNRRRNDDAPPREERVAREDRTERPARPDPAPERDRSERDRSERDRSERDRSERDRGERDRSERGNERDRGDRRERRGRRDDDLGPSVIGFGDHVPAFILRPVYPAKEPLPIEA